MTLQNEPRIAEKPAQLDGGGSTGGAINPNWATDQAQIARDASHPQINLDTTERRAMGEYSFQRNDAIQAAILFPDLQVNQAGIKERLSASSRDYAHIYDISLGDRMAHQSTAAKDNVEWNAKFTTWVDQVTGKTQGYERNQKNAQHMTQIFQALGVSDPSSYESLLTEYANNRENMNVFIAKMSQLDDLEAKLPLIRGICAGLYGHEVSSTIISQVVDLEARIKAAGGETAKIDELTAALTKGTSEPNSESAEILMRAEEFLRMGIAQNQKKAEEKTAAVPDGASAVLVGKAEGDPMSADAGGAIVGHRGRYTKDENKKDVLASDRDERGQDRLFYKKLSNGIQVYALTDGAGIKGHTVAEKVSQRLAELLDGKDPNSISQAGLLEISQQIHSEMQNFSGEKSGATLDTIIKLPNGKKFAIHVGEGQLYRVRKAAEMQGALQQGNLFEAVTKPHGFGLNEEGKAKRTANGYKTREMGVDAEITPDVFELVPDSVYILASDGYSDVAANAPISSIQFMKLLKESPQKAAEYLTRTASDFSLKTYGEMEADDVGVMVVN